MLFKIFTISSNILNYTKSSCIIFWIKMSRYSHYTYCLQEIWPILVWRYRDSLAQKLITKNYQYSQRLFKLYQFFMNNFLCKTLLKSSLYILPTLITTWLFQFCVITYPKLFLSNFTYTTNINIILLENWNYKKLLKFVDNTNF